MINEKKVIGVVLIISGLLLISFSPTLTGNTINESTARGVGSILGIILVAVGISLLEFERAERKGGELEVLVSNTVQRKLKKDRTLANNSKKVINEIGKIARDPSGRPKETLGEFSVSPRGHNEIRIVWYFDPATNRVYIEDVFSHESGEYDGHNGWATLARARKITRSNYTGYRRYEEVI